MPMNKYALVISAWRNLKKLPAILAWLGSLCAWLAVSSATVRAYSAPNPPASTPSNSSKPSAPPVANHAGADHEKKAVTAQKPAPVDTSHAESPSTSEGHTPADTNHFITAPSSGATNESGQLLQTEFLTAQRLRLEGQYSEAAGLLKKILEQPAPEAVQKNVLLELALTAKGNHQPTVAQQIYAQFVNRYPNDNRVPAVLFWQGLLYREMGSDAMALTKFYSVMTSCLNLKLDVHSDYQILVLRAQIEIALTYYSTGKYAEAADFFGRLLKLENPELNKAQIHFHLVRCLSMLNLFSEASNRAVEFLQQYPESSEAAEVRFLLAVSFKQLKRTQDSMNQVSQLLKDQSSGATQNAANWVYWQQRTGNEIANQLYKEGDFGNALAIYEQLAKLDKSPKWQLPVLYQTAQVYEHLNQPQKATEQYDQIAKVGLILGTNAPPSLLTLVDMAKWRKQNLEWSGKADEASKNFRISVSP